MLLLISVTKNHGFMGLFCLCATTNFNEKIRPFKNFRIMKIKFALLSLFLSLSLWAQNGSGTGTGTQPGGGSITKVIISSSAFSSTLEILPTLTEAKVIGYKIYNSTLELKKDVAIAPTNNEIIVVENIENDKYYILLLLDKEEEAKWIISKQFIKE
jgi:hypothetical protein